MFSKIAINISKIKKENINKEIFRLGMAAEIDAINLYEQLADMTDDESVKKILLDVACEEKTHLGEFETMLLKFDSEQSKELEAGKDEVEELLE